ncbi:aspartic peptidase domain-containing protein [Xylariales sp. PMI_506]|nr:aspartic peptidase domain-containing protein [Xylariales sp. PMI_506]
MNFAVATFVFLVCQSFDVVWAASTNGSSAEAVVISPSEYFEGNDGPWSSFNIRVGTPQQDVRVLVSTASPESMVVLSDLGCSTTAFSGSSVPSNCAVSRGVLFNPNESSTWNNVGTYAINGDGVGLEANLGYSENAEFALESLGVGLTGPNLTNQTVAGIGAAEPLYLGIFGLNNQPVNFSSLGNYSAPSFLTTLKSQGLIPSLSWSYTAGAQYRLKQVYGQLIFSGYDTSRFDPDNSVSFTMAGDVTRDLVVALQSISYSGTTQATLLSDPIEIFIDSTDPNLWLPDSVCDAFESAFGLTIDNTTGLYLVNDTHHSNLLDSDAEVVFRLSDVGTGGETVTITLPYNSFDLTAEAPLVSNTSYYFPLKRAANSTQYTLGRTFLQEAYLTADYERGVFNVSACVWNQGATETIVTISSTDGSSSSSGSSSSGNPAHLSGGAIAGIVVGCVVFVALIGIIIALKIRRRDIVITYAAHEHDPDQTVMSGPVFNSGSQYFGSSIPTGSSPAHTIADSHELETDGHEVPAVVPSSPIVSGHTQQIQSHNGHVSQVYAVNGLHELHGDSDYPTNGDVGQHGIQGRAVAGSPLRAHEDLENRVSVLPSHDEREEEDESSLSPVVSKADTTEWRHSAFGNDEAKLVSPISPVHRREKA